MSGSDDGAAGTSSDARLHPHTRRVIQAANEAGLTVTVTRFPAGTRTAADAAAAIGCPVAAIAKSIVLRSDQGPLLVLTSGANRVDYAKVARATGRSGVDRSDAEEARAATGYPIGGTAPFGHPVPLFVLIDADLLALDEVWAAAGTPDTVFSISPDDLCAATQAQVADIAEAG